MPFLKVIVSTAKNIAKKLVQNGEKALEMESYDKQPHISNIKCHLTKYGAFRSLFWDKMYTLFRSAPKSALRSQRVKQKLLLDLILSVLYLWFVAAQKLAQQQLDGLGWKQTHMNYYYLNTVTSNQDIHVMFTRKKISLLCTDQMYLLYLYAPGNLKSQW